MKLPNRIFSYLIMFVIYWFSTSILISLDEILKIGKVFITLGCGFTLINIIYSFLILKWTILLNLFSSIIIAALSLYGGSSTSNNYILDVNENAINININNYANGIYTVALVVDGKITDAKTLIKQ